jgi:hypothetical protein
MNIGISAKVILSRKGDLVNPLVIKKVVGCEAGDELLQRSKIGVDGSYVKIRTNPSSNLNVLKSEFFSLLEDLMTFAKQERYELEMYSFDLHSDCKGGLGIQKILLYELSKEFPLSSKNVFPIIPTSYGVELRDLNPKVLPKLLEIMNSLKKKSERLSL